MQIKKLVNLTGLPSTLTDRNIIDALQIDVTNPTEQAIANRLSNNFNPVANRLLLLDWLTANNLPFSIVNDARFQRLLLYNNPLLQVHDLPKAMTLWRILHDEYQRALGPITEILKTSRGMIHLTFDGWTSKSMLSFIGIDVHFVDRDFRQHTFRLGLPPVRGTHKGLDAANDVGEVLSYFDIGNL